MQATSTAGRSRTLSGTYRCIRRLLGLLPKPVTSVSEAADARGAATATRSADNRGRTAARSTVNSDLAGRLAAAGTCGDLLLMYLSFLDCLP